MILTSCNDITYIRPFEVQYFFCRKCLSIALDNLYNILNEKSKVATKSACVISHKFSAQNTWEIRQALAETLDCNYLVQASTKRGRFDKLVPRTFLIFKENRSSYSIGGNRNFKRNLLKLCHLNILYIAKYRMLIYL